MSDFVGGWLAVIIIFYAAFCVVVVPVHIYGMISNERKCAELHQVYKCKLVREWVPIVGEKK